MKQVNKILEDVIKKYPDKISLKELSQFEHGKKTGQQEVIRVFQYLTKKLSEGR